MAYIRVRCRLRSEPELGAETECFFFFQAEDGIRDLTVTGVQTCALPICARPRPQVPATGKQLARAARAGRPGRLARGRRAPQARARALASHDRALRCGAARPPRLAVAMEQRDAHLRHRVTRPVSRRAEPPGAA